MFLFKNCIQRNVIKNNSFLSTRSPNIFIKRDINFGKIRRIWRIIRLKDRGVDHNFKKDRIDPKSNVMVYKAEVNRVCTLGGIAFPMMIIMACICVKLWLILDNSVKEFDPYDRPGFLRKYFFETLIIVSILHISLSKRYILRMYFNRNKNMFIISTWRWYLPFRTHISEAKPGSAVELENLNQNALIETMFGNTRIGRKRYYLTAEHFTYPLYYNVLFGFSPPEALKEMSFGSDNTEMTEQLLRQKAKTKEQNLSPF